MFTPRPRIPKTPKADAKFGDQRAPSMGAVRSQQSAFPKPPAISGQNKMAFPQVKPAFPGGGQ